MKYTTYKVIEDFFEDWEEKVFQWYKNQKEEVDNIGGYQYEKMYKDTLAKRDIELIKHHPLFPTKGHARDIQGIIKEDIKFKKQKLYHKIGNKVGEVTEVELRCGADGTMNGIVRGDKGVVTIQTILAGGWNIQKLHYRVLVK